MSHVPRSSSDLELGESYSLAAILIGAAALVSLLSGWTSILGVVVLTIATGLVLYGLAQQSM